MEERSALAKLAKLPTPRRVKWAAFLAATGLLTVQFLRIHPWTVDDAFIFYRYAQHLADGHGLVFNVGERVEGYTSFLWTLLLTPAPAVGLSVELWSKILCAACCGAVLLVVACLPRWIPQIDHQVAAAAIVLLGATGSFSFAVVSGMETALACLLVTLAVVLACRDDAPRPRWSRAAGLGAVCALAAMTRPEALMVVALISLVLLVGAARRREPRRMLPLLWFAALYVPYYLWRLQYYGYPLPNTFYAKVGQSGQQLVRGLEYSASFAVTALPLLLGLALSIPWALAARGRRPLMMMTAVASGFIGYVVAVGGDCIPGFRFFTPAVPSMAILAAVALRWLYRRQRWLAGAALLLAVGHQVVESHTHRWFRTDGVTLPGQQVGAWLRDHAPRDALLATNTAGSVAFVSALPTIDMLGLNDVHIAHRHIPSLGSGFPGHEKGDGAYVLSRQPDFIQFGGPAGAVRPAFIGGHEMVRLAGFHQRYVLRRYRLGPPANTALLYVKRSRHYAHAAEVVERHDFERRVPATARLEGDGFSRELAGPDSGDQLGAEGRYLESTDAGIARLVLEPLVLRGDILQFRFGGGGADPSKVYVALHVDGVVRHRVAGTGRPLMRPVIWDVSAYRGQEAMLEIVDDANDPGGRVLFDSLQQLDAAALRRSYDALHQDFVTGKVHNILGELAYYWSYPSIDAPARQRFLSHFSQGIDFEEGRLPPGMRCEGDGFRDNPVRQEFPGQWKVEQTQGVYYLNSFSGGNGSTGRCVLEDLPLEGQRLRFLIGGGRSLKRLYVALRVDGKIRYRATGRRGEFLSEVVWDISPYAGRGVLGDLEIVDDRSGSWGHLLVDWIVQTDR